MGKWWPPSPLPNKTLLGVISVLSDFIYSVPINSMIPILSDVVPKVGYNGKYDSYHRRRGPRIKAINKNGKYINTKLYNYELILFLICFAYFLNSF